MSFALTFMIPPTRNVKTRVFTDPAQYDTEVNAARGFSKPLTTRMRTPMTQVMEDFSDLNEASQLINHVTEREVIEAQNFWAQSIVDISNSFLSGGDYVSPQVSVRVSCMDMTILTYSSNPRKLWSNSFVLPLMMPCLTLWEMTL